MSAVGRKSRWLFLGLLLFWACYHLQVGLAQDGKEGKDGKESQAEKIRKALDQKMLIDFTGNNLQDCLKHLKEKIGVNIVLDVYAMGNFPFDDGGLPMGVPGVPGGGQVHLKNDKDSKVRVGLQRMLNAYNLTYVVVDESVLITTEEIGLYRQMRQRVSVDVKEQPLKAALKDLARNTGLNMVIDPRVLKSAEAPVSLEVDDATLETAVKLLAEMGNLKAVRMGNVMFVTSEDRAEKIRRAENEGQPRNPMHDGGIFPGGGMFGAIGFGGGFGGGVPPAIFRNIGVRAGVAVPDNAPPPPDRPVPPPAVDRPLPPATDPAVPPVQPPEKR